MKNLNNSEALLLFIGILNSITFIIMGADKKYAKKKARRVSEKTIWSLSIIGGAIGAYIGMKVFRHKTKHQVFIIGMPVLIITHLFIYIYFKLS